MNFISFMNNHNEKVISVSTASEGLSISATYETGCSNLKIVDFWGDKEKGYSRSAFTECYERLIAKHFLGERSSVCISSILFF